MFQKRRMCVNSQGTLGCEGIFPGLLQETGAGLLGGMRPESPRQGHSFLNVLPPPSLQPLTDPLPPGAQVGSAESGLHPEPHSPVPKSRLCHS